MGHLFEVDEINIGKNDEWGLSLWSRSSSTRKYREMWLLLGTMQFPPIQCVVQYLFHILYMLETAYEILPCKDRMLTGHALVFL